MATQWIDADLDTLLRLAYMADWEGRGEGNVTLRREIRVLEDAFGLNPASRAHLRWQIGPDDDSNLLPIHGEPCHRRKTEAEPRRARP
jgi:hypothetical protein